MTRDNAIAEVVDVWLDVLSPLVEATKDDSAFAELLAQMSWIAQTLDLDELATAASTLDSAVTKLRDEISFDSLPELVKTLASLGGVAASLANFAQGLAAAAGEPAATAGVLKELAADLLQHLVLLWVGRQSPTAYSALELVGIIDRAVPTPVSTGGPTPLLARVAMTRPVLALDAMGRLLSDPADYLTQRLGVNALGSVAEAEQMLQSLFRPLRDLVVSAGGIGVVGIEDLDLLLVDASDLAVKRQASFLIPLPVFAVLGEPVASKLGLAIELVPTGLSGPAGDAGPGVSLIPSGSLDVKAELEGARLELAVTAGLASVFLPKGKPPVVHGAPDGVHARFAFVRVPDSAGAPALTLGSDTLGLSISGFQAVVESRFGRATSPRLDLDISAAVEKASFVLAPGEGDGFLSKVLPADGLQFDFDLGIGWSSQRGVYFSGAASLEAEFPLHASLLGVLTIDIVHLALAADDAGLRVAVAASATLELGPLSASVQRMGLEAKATFPAGGGNLGPLDLGARFLPPRGVGMVLDASVIKGGGFILNDPDHGRYAGILELKIGDIVTVSAIGLLTTRMPDDSEGFSLLVILTATFPPIQLGLGFTLSGLGGLLGLNRTMNVQALRDGVRTGVLDSILFPVDPVARANKVISDVESVFPVAQDRFTIGLMVRLGWGSPRFVTADIGIIVALPMPLQIALIGRLAIVLPDPEAAVVDLKLDVVGILDFGRKELSIDASLHDSRIAVFDLYGDMAVRIGWGECPAFLISIGGFNPRFVPQPGFPQMRRLTISLATSDNPRVRLETYLALTSNTLQAGARLDVHAELDTGVLGLFSADAGFGFDALIVIDPFEFIVDLSGGCVIKRNGTPFVGAEVLLTLYGPQPMRAVGYAEVHFFGTHRIPILINVGPDAISAVLAAVDPLGALLAALGRVESWSALPPASEPGVSSRQQELSGTLLAHPMGSLAVRQRVVPLGVKIDRYGGVPLDGGARSYSLSYKVGTTTAQNGAPLRDAWAPGDLFTLSDDEKLSRPSFEQLLSGDHDIAAPEVRFGPPQLVEEEKYETRVIDQGDPLPQPSDLYTVPASAAPLLDSKAADALTDAAGYSGPSLKVGLSEPTYVLASQQDLSRVGTSHPSWLEAHQAIGGRAHLQVVGSHEVTS
ncbi:DUF6603 domain-containing protein [Corallococcus exiguus]|uniref:DUF6603 domain-containing protein n=1 Tax=Corallococcus exiguus TaxID=83462 RepID=UPI001560862B|nr:DUF6603 domain-containing protein [Corallococcus exiguus]NRD43903.1 hypothetical protein [Corallococcus exiguus]